MRELRREEFQHRCVFRDALSFCVPNDIADCVLGNGVQLACNRRHSCHGNPNRHRLIASAVLVDCRPLDLVLAMYLELSDRAYTLNEIPNALLKTYLYRVPRDTED